MFNFFAKIPEIIHEAKQMQYLFLGLVRTAWLTNLSTFFRLRRQKATSLAIR